MEKFKPNLIPNHNLTFEEFLDVVNGNGGVKEYIITRKKDGCRLEMKDGESLSREFKTPKSNLVVDRFKELAELCGDLGIILEGEFYSHGMKFNEIYRFFANADVTSDKVKVKLEKELNKDPQKFNKGYNSRSIEWLTTFHKDLKFHWFDGVSESIKGLGYQERMYELAQILSPFKYIWEDVMVLPDYINSPHDNLEQVYDDALSDGWEGLVLTHINHKYKFGRTSMKQGTLLKLKDDKNEFDGVVIDVVEGTNIKDGIARSLSNLGNSKTSQFKDDREPSGMAKGFITEFKGEEFIVSLKGFDNTMKVELLKNKANYIGRHFKFTAMNPTVSCPRHAFFNCWRDAK